MASKDIVPVLFEGHSIRRKIADGTVYYSAVDIIAAITESKDPRKLWVWTKHALEADGIQPSNITRRFKLKAEDGKMRLTDCLSSENVILMIEYLHSPKAAPFRIWFAKLASERAEEIADPAKGMQNAIAAYKKQGKDDKWIAARFKAVSTYGEKCRLWAEHGVEKPSQYAVLTNLQTEAWSGMSVAEYEARLGCAKGKRRDAMSEVELLFDGMADASVADYTRKTNPQGFSQNKEATRKAAGVVGEMRKLYEERMGLILPPPPYRI